ncbi:MAG: hypothetical protein C0404_07070 [Verrucomicrobia bacterium]|nr:hypothetical protein [Verrucomicrobiota bacterium]
MRIMLVQPKLNPRVASLGKLEPIALEILAAALPGHQVRIFDFRFERSLACEIKDWQPDIVGVTALTVEYPEAVTAIQEVRGCSPGIRIVVGGTHATMSPGDFNLPGVAAIVRGLGHRTFSELIGAFISGNDPAVIPGLALPRDGKLLFTGNRPPETEFSEIPRPARSLTERYRRFYRPTYYKSNVGVAITSLGCPARCAFCSSWKQNEGRYLELDAKSVVEDILSVPEDEVMLADDNSLHNTERAWEIARLLRERKNHKRIRTYARADTIAANPDLLKALRAAGLRALIVGYEAASDARLRRYNKGTTMEINRAAMKVLREAGIQNRAMFVISQDFTREDFDELSGFIESEGVCSPQFTVFTPTPGTPLYEQEQENLLTREYAYYDFTHCVLPTRMDYMAFFDEYAGLYKRAYSPLRYLRMWRRDLGEFLLQGRWPMTERRLTSLARSVIAGMVLNRRMRTLRRDYEVLAADVLPAGGDPVADGSEMEAGQLGTVNAVESLVGIERT